MNKGKRRHLPLVFFEAAIPPPAFEADLGEEEPRQYQIEDRGELEDLLVTFAEHLRPRNPLEEIVTDLLITTVIRLRRVIAWEATAVARQTLSCLTDEWKDLDRISPMAEYHNLRLGLLEEILAAIEAGETSPDHIGRVISVGEDLAEKHGHKQILTQSEKEYILALAMQEDETDLKRYVENLRTKSSGLSLLYQEAAKHQRKLERQLGALPPVDQLSQIAAYERQLRETLAWCFETWVQLCNEEPKD